MEQQFDLKTSEQWKAFSHPLRLRILELLAAEALTNEELAARVGEQSGKLYFHTKKLLNAGLIVLDSTRQKGPITEKLYRAAARRFTTPSPVKGGSTPPLEPYLVAGLNLYRAAWAETDGLPNQIEGGFHLVLPLSAARRAEFATRFQALLDDFRASASDAPDAQKIALTVLIHGLDTHKEKKDAPADGDFGSADGRKTDGSAEDGTRRQCG